MSKEVFPGLLKKLWDISFKPEHCKGGFRGAGIVPYSREHVLDKLALPPGPALGQCNDATCIRPGAEGSDVQSPGAESLGMQSPGAEGSGVESPGAEGSGVESPGAEGSGVESPGAEKITCTKCGNSMTATPILKTHIISYFAGILEIRKEAPRIGQRNNLKIRIEGEALTSDEFQGLLDEESASKEAEKVRKAEKRARKAEEKACKAEERASEKARRAEERASEKARKAEERAEERAHKAAEKARKVQEKTQKGAAKKKSAIITNGKYY